MATIFLIFRLREADSNARPTGPTIPIKLLNHFRNTVGRIAGEPLLRMFSLRRERQNDVDISLTE